MSESALDIKSFTGLSQDSRAVKPGYLFAALPGSKVDGSQYIDDAVKAGASAVLAGKGAKVPAGVQLIADENPRRRFALMAAAFYGAQPDFIAAVTGTNGKTSTVHFARQLWESLGIKAASLGTLGLHGGGFDRSGSLTTPDTVALHADLAALAKASVTHLVMEASSHGLDQYRLDGVKVRAAGFTNLTRDHLDYHADMAAYLAAKRRLFTDILAPGGIAVLNADVNEYHEICPDKTRHVLSYGHQGKNLKILKREPAATGQQVHLEVMGQRFEMMFPLAGEFQLMNALCALGIVMAEDAQNTSRTAKLVGALGSLRGVPGRLQSVAGHPKGAGVYVDYAHTPDALENILKALRPHTQGSLVCVFGCGGNRDKGKRPLMGKVATELADRVIVTDDNPRKEDAAQIRKEIMAGAPGALEIPGRREAIRHAVSGLEKRDVLVIAGKGHEQGQIIGDTVHEFDDVKVAAQAIREVGA